MGWFDKKSWQLRRKIRDLQSELAVAERDGKYVIAQGLFFAELQEMGDATLMVLGAADHLDSEEAAMIKTFFERNGFTVESLRLDRTQKNLAAVEIIPPEELTRRVAKSFKERGFKLIDDSENERPSNVEKNIITLSGLVRSLSALFSSHVHHMIVSGPLKMNMEGNRLLHWLPLIRDELTSRVPEELLFMCREPFVDAYNHYYGRFGQMENYPVTEDNDDSALEKIDEHLATPEKNETVGSTPWLSPISDDSPAKLIRAENPPETNLANRVNVLDSKTVTDNKEREIEAAHTVARMYKSLIGASDQRKPRNAEMLLEYVSRFYHAKSACILARKNTGGILTLVANSGGINCVQTDSEGAVSCASNTLEECLSTHKIVIGKPTNGNANPAAVAAPLLLESTLDAVLYLVEPAGFGQEDISHLAQFAQVFREFPDLLISTPVEKNRDTQEIL